MITDFELGWLIGLLEGEGSFSYYTGKGHVVWLEMTDYDTVEKAANIIGQITNRKHKPWHNRRSTKYGTKDSYILQIRSKAAVILMQKIVKHMGKRRRIQIWKALNNYTRPSRMAELMEIINGSNHTNA